MTVTIDSVRRWLDRASRMTLAGDLMVTVEAPGVAQSSIALDLVARTESNSDLALSYARRSTDRGLAAVSVCLWVL